MTYVNLYKHLWLLTQWQAQFRIFIYKCKYKWYRICKIYFGLTFVVTYVMFKNNIWQYKWWTTPPQKTITTKTSGYKQRQTTTITKHTFSFFLPLVPPLSSLETVLPLPTVSPTPSCVVVVEDKAAAVVVLVAAVLMFFFFHFPVGWVSSLVRLP